MMFFSCQTKILKVNPKDGVYALHVNSWGNVYVMGYYQSCFVRLRYHVKGLFYW